MRNDIPLLPESVFTQTAPCQRCGKSAVLIRMSPMSEAGRYLRTFECAACGITFLTTDESDAEIMEVAERMTGKPPRRPRRQLLPKVVADRAAAMHEYRQNERDALKRLKIQKAARQAREAQQKRPGET